MAGRPIQHVEANGLRFAYLEQGEGPLVLLLHGFPDTARTWDDVRPRLAAKGYRAVSPWMRGYAPTAIPPHDTSFDTMSRDVVALIEALGESSAILVGHDWGAVAAYGAAALEPGRVSKLFTLAVPHPASWRVTPGKLWGVRHFIAFKLPGAPGRFARNDFAALPAIYKRWSPAWSPAAEEFAAIRECFADPASLRAAFGYYRALRPSTPRYMRSPVQVPTVVFAGRNDGAAVPDDYRVAERMFAAGYVVEDMPGGHFLHREHPGEFADRLLAHL